MKKITLTLIAAVCCTVSFAQTIPQQEWVQTFNGTASLNDGAFVVDVDGSIVVSGVTETNPGTFKILTVKYDSAGTQLWSIVHNSPGLFPQADFANFVTTDNLGNIYIAASVAIGSGGGDKEFTIIKYNSSGVQQWVATHSDTGEAYSLVLGPSGNLYVTGWTKAGTSTREDFTTVKYNSSGVEQWTVKYGGTERDNANSIAIDGAGNIYITGTNLNTTTNRANHTTVKYNNSGVQQWTATFTNGSFAFTGDEQRSVVAASNIVLDNGNVYVTAAGDNGGSADYVTIKYNNSGIQQWIRTFNGSGNGVDYISDLGILSSGEIVVTGESFGGSSDVDFVTIQYDANGGQRWLQWFNGTANGADRARGLAISNTNEIHVTGVSFNGTNNDFATVKYSSDGIEEWDMIFNGVADDNDEANDIGVDIMGNIYVVGLSSNGSNFDFATIKYGLKEVFIPQDISLVDFGFPEAPASGHTYYTNRGQIVDHDGNPRRDIKLYTIHSTPAIFVTDNTLSYVFSVSDTIPSGGTIPNTIISGQRIDMKLVGGNPNIRAFKTEKTSGHLNFFLPHIPNGITKMNGYSRVVCNDVYPNIDMQYYSSSQGLKYYFIIHPGGNADDIVLRFEGANAVDVTGAGRLKLSTDFGDMFFDAGHAYQINPGGNVVPMPWQAKFEKVSANEVKFDIRNYPKHMPLIIQVDRGHQLSSGVKRAEWLSHLGGSEEDRVIAVTTDSQGSVYYTGLTKSTDFPVDTGAFQDTLINTNLNSDAFIAGFDFNYAPKFITYLGGGLPDWGSVISWSSANGKLYIAGETRGGPNDLDLNFPTIDLGGNSYFDSVYSSGSFETGYIGRMDTATGIPDWLSYYGGAKTFITSMTLDPAGNVYIAGAKQDTVPGNSTTCNNPPNGGFPLCNLGGAAYYQDFHADRNDNVGFLRDGFFSKFNASGELLHSSFWGGTNPGNTVGFDFIYDIAVDNVSNAFYMVGSTNSQRFSAPSCGVPTDGSFPICFPGGGYAEENLNAGIAGTQHDGFVAKLDLTTLELLRSTYFGSEGDDIITGIDVNSSGDKYFVGVTNSITSGSPECQEPTNGGFPYCSPPDAYNSDFSGDSSLYRKFISKFDTNDSLVWSTAIIRSFSLGDNKNVFGMESVISPRIAVNDSGNIYMIGTTWDLAYTYMGNGQYYYENTIGDYGASDPVSDAVVTGFDGLDNSLVISTFLGGEGFESSAISPRRGDVGLAIATFLDDRVYVGGFTYSKSATPFPTYNPTPVNSYFQENCVSCDNLCGVFPNQKYCSDGFVGQIKKGILTGIEESPSESAINTDFSIIAYPNPANNQITIKFSLYDKMELYFAVYNIIGEVVYSESQKYRAGTFEKQLDLSRYANGMYLIQVQSEKINRSLKIIKE